ncbi:MAG TPA: response regulator transcription factor [Terriglobales bacterium]
MSRELRPRVLLADDHTGILRALQRMLGASCDIVGRVTAGSSLLEETRKLRPDVVVLDIRLPDIDGIEACRQIKHAIPQTKVIVLTAANDAEIKQQAFNVGASAFVVKHAMVDDLLKAVCSAFYSEGSSHQAH